MAREAFVPGIDTGIAALTMTQNKCYNSIYVETGYIKGRTGEE
jgi:hypothetical protein